MTEPTDTIGDDVKLWRGDCLAVLPHLSGIDAVITDPPYGMDWDTDSTRFSGGQSEKIARTRGDGRSDWGAVANDAEPFDPSPWLEFPRVVLWGSNHYAPRLPVGTTLIWLKKAAHLFGTFLSDAEVAWMKGGCGVYCHLKQFPPPSRIKEGGGRVLHPCQKPVGLMKWCIEKAKVPTGGTILDPYMGSGTVGVAAMQMGYRYVGIELDPAHYETARKRLLAATGGAPGQLFSGVV